MKLAQATARSVAAIICFVILLVGPGAYAQRTPEAAPTGPNIQSQQLGTPQAAPTAPVDVAQTGNTVGPGFAGVSIYSLFMRADPIVKSVMAILALASLWSWAIIFNKWFVLGSLRRRADKFEKNFWSGTSLDDLYQQYVHRIDHPMAAVFASVESDMDYLLKTEPSEYSFADLQREKNTVWDGVSNPVALKNLRGMKPAERLVIYHTGDEKSAVGTASVVSVDASDARNPRVTIKVGKAIAKPVTLAEVKASATFAESPLVRQGRLSVVPLNAAQYKFLTGE
jgi:predicted RNA-binding protein with PUA-like domain